MHRSTAAKGAEPTPTASPDALRVDMEMAALEAELLALHAEAAAPAKEGAGRRGEAAERRAKAAEERLAEMQRVDEMKTHAIEVAAARMAEMDQQRQVSTHDTTRRLFCLVRVPCVRRAFD